MVMLKIQPVEYHGNRLRQVGDNIVKVFPIFHDYKINDRIHLSDLGSILLEDADSNPPQERHIRGQDFLKFLSFYDKPILGITLLPTTRYMSGGWIYGNGSKPLVSAYVSVARPEFERINTDNHVERLIIEALHELGHVFGLSHHNSWFAKNTPNGRLCPMDISHVKEAWGGKISWAEYISSRDPYSFCKDCEGQLDDQLIELFMRSLKISTPTR